ncbi:MAG TPA: phenylalanine--tRNA ligase subunit beta [Bacteroidales bacterium]|nr:phenylalanine--tRNA ligase subunit beta [Bacteroidales bacterium]HNR43002.1 phenylalanine--tRNA ligase subunit beta [Bacteroidales bacterium]HPM18056.1 phenylalanine--tRNA ligase subunit beta [Bacteroidales bacterium]
MKISYNWLKDYLATDLAPQKVAEILTDIGLEIESIEEWESVRGGMKKIVVGEVLTCTRHPGADRLFLTTVDVGSGEPLRIVCGAPNVATGQKVAVATEGAVIYQDEKVIEIKKSKIRGEISEGMICAEDELGLGNDHTGIVVLDINTKPGTPAAEYFNVISDTVFVIGLTPNRIDSGSHYGVARDLAAYLSLNTGKTFKARLPSVDDFKPDNTNNTYDIIVENPIDCPRYTGITISDIRVGESPEWLKNRLKAIGLNPINNIVDITNFVQNEIGQSLHAFDADQIRGKKVIIKNLPDKTKFVTLDETERSLSSRDLMICDIAEGMCIAGVFGGIKSGITSESRNVFLESAYFNPVTIRKTSKRHGLQTDASFRFERGADPNITDWALKRAAMLIRDIAGGNISSEIVDIYPNKIQNVLIEVNYSNINRLIGKKIEKSTVKRILELLEIIVRNEENDSLLLEIPAYKVDVKCEADVVEELLRIYGYNNVQFSSHVNSTLTYIEKPDKEKVVNTISDLLSDNGFTEIMCNSLNPASWYENNPDFNSDTLVRLANPLSSDLNAMRQSLLFGGLNSVVWNIHRQNPDLKLYEFGNCYFRKDNIHGFPEADDYIEKTSLDLFITGNFRRENWNQKTNPSDFFHIKSATEMILIRLGIKPEMLTAGESDKSYFSESASYFFNNMLVAETGMISRNYLTYFDIAQDVYYTHFEWDMIMELIRNSRIVFRELPRYPTARRDLALLVDKEIRFAQIRELAFKTEQRLLKEVGLFDVYENESLGHNKKSYAVSFILRDDDQTLTDRSIEKVMNNLIRVYEKDLNAKIR